LKRILFKVLAVYPKHLWVLNTPPFPFGLTPKLRLPFPVLPPFTFFPPIIPGRIYLSTHRPQLPPPSVFSGFPTNSYFFGLVYFFKTRTVFSLFIFHLSTVLPSPFFLVIPPVPPPFFPLAGPYPTHNTPFPTPQAFPPTYFFAVLVCGFFLRFSPTDCSILSPGRPTMGVFCSLSCSPPSLIPPTLPTFSPPYP